MRRGGRLLLLVGILIAAAAAGLLFVYLQTLTPGGSAGQDGVITAEPTEDPGVNIVIATADIRAGTVISDATLLTSELISTEDFNQNRTQYLLNISDALNKLAINDIAGGSPVFKNALTDPGLSQQIPPADEGRPRDKAIAFRVDALIAVADQIKERDFVDIVASFPIVRRVSLPGTIDPNGNELRTFEPFEYYSTKTIVQRVQVVKIVRPPAPPEEGEEGAGAAPPPPVEPTVAVDASGQPVQAAPTSQAGPSLLTQGEWVLVMLMNDQEAELLDYARNTNAKISLVLRGAGDTDFEVTTGVTLDLLIAEYGVVLPNPPAVYSYSNEEIAPQPTRTPAPTRVP